MRTEGFKRFCEAMAKGEVVKLRESGMSLQKIADIYGISAGTVHKHLDGIAIYMKCEMCGERYLSPQNDHAHICEDCKERKYQEGHRRPKLHTKKRRKSVPSFSLEEIIKIQSYTKQLTGKYYTYGKLCNALYGRNRRY